MGKYLLLFLVSIVLYNCTDWSTPLPLSETARNFRLSSCNTSAVVLNEGFEGTAVPNFLFNTSGDKASVLVSKDKQLAGSQSLRFRLTDVSVKKPQSLRSELIMYQNTTDVSELWYGFSTYMPSETMKGDTDPVLFMYWSSNYYGYKGGYSYQNPVITLALLPNNTVQLIYQSAAKAPTKAAQLSTTPAVYRNLGKMVFDQWVDYVIHVRFDPVEKQGVLQIWQDGASVLNEQQIPIGHKDGKPFWRFGLTSYTGKSSHKERLIYFDQFRLGNEKACYDAVAPGDARDIYKPMKP